MEMQKTVTFRWHSTREFWHYLNDRVIGSAIITFSTHPESHFIKDLLQNVVDYLCLSTREVVSIIFSHSDCVSLFSVYQCLDALQTVIRLRITQIVRHTQEK